MDLFVFLSYGKLYADLHVKANDCHQYLTSTSSHPDHAKKLIAYSQMLCLSRHCSFEEDSEPHKSRMRSWFFKKRYPEQIIDKEMSKVQFDFSRKMKPKEKK